MEDKSITPETRVVLRVAAVLVPLILVVMVAPRAHAVGRSVELCFTITTDYEDRGGGDRWTVDGSKRYRGVRAEVSETASGSVLFDDYAGPDGCVTLTLDTLERYDVVVRDRIQVDEQEAMAFTDVAGADDNAADDLVAERTLRSGFSGTLWSGTTENQIAVPWTPQTAALAVAGMVFHQARWTDNLDTYPLRIYEKRTGPGCGVVDPKPKSSPPGTPGPIEKGTGPGPGVAEPTSETFPPGSLRCSTTNLQRQWTMAHEIGHVIAYRREAGEDPACVEGCDAAQLNGQVDDTACDDGCNVQGATIESRSFLSKEYQAYAAREGWANFVAAATFNRVAEDDCEFRLNTGTLADLDQDGKPQDLRVFFARQPGVTGDIPFNRVSCDGALITPELCAAWATEFGRSEDEVCPDPDGLSNGLDGEDWLESMVGAEDDVPDCSGTIASRSTSWDWLRFWWEMATEKNVALPQLAELLDNMDPRDWDPDESATGQGLSSTADDVIQRLTEAAAATTCFPANGNSCAASVADEANNGQDH